MSSAQMSCARNPRILPLTRLDIDLALGRVELAGDPLLPSEEFSCYGSEALRDRRRDDDSYFDDPCDLVDEWWALEDDFDVYDPVLPPEPPEEAWPDWGALED